MESEKIYYNTEHKNDSNSFNPRYQSGEDINTNDNDTDNTQKHCRSFIQNQAANYSKSRCFVMITVLLGFICVLLLVAIIVQHNKLSTERDLMKMSYMNVVEEYNESLSSLKINYSQMIDEREELQNRFNSMSQKKLELETDNKHLTGKKEELQKTLNSMSQEKLELEAQLTLQRGSSWYYISSERKSWSDSRQFCRDRGHDLVIINTEEEQRFISSIIKEDVWIGLSYTQHEGVLKWVDETPLKRGFWLQGEPNSLGSGEDCIEILFSLPPENNWNDYSCSSQKIGICEN